ncbi:unnamed protein product [Caenorhabditis auriculariae]|uniref:Reverse transcriptase domain-containing protein n=1 Tax=Caenorhabditis auriculariae TaxID=2777116 RepID=A0A8S1H482_9PELO|nr:unnamed protein product [Caenorhabditis auriculariae]
METMLQGVPGVIVYLDDITITAPSDEEHIKRLREVLKRIKDYGFRVKKEKCEFLKPEIEYLGHIVNAEGVKTSSKKVEAIVKMPPPKNLKELQSFLGMITYYGKYIPNLSSESAPLNRLRQNDAEWVWGEKEQMAIDKIKKILVDSGTLAHYDPTEQIVLATDASDYGLGAVIYHKYRDGTEKVIAYASRTLTGSEKNYAQIEKEALGIIYGIEKFNQYLYGRKFLLLTDHKPLLKIFGPKEGLPVIAAKRLQRWALKLMTYSYEIEYRNTEKFGNADGLSRLPNPDERVSEDSQQVEGEILALHEEAIAGLPVTAEEIAKEVAKDSALQKILPYVQDRHKKMSDKPSRKKSKHHEGRPPAAKKPREQTPPEQHQEELPFVPTYLRLHRIQQSLNSLKDQMEILIARTAHHSPPAPPSLPATD